MTFCGDWSRPGVYARLDGAKGVPIKFGECHFGRSWRGLEKSGIWLPAVCTGIHGLLAKSTGKTGKIPQKIFLCLVLLAKSTGNTGKIPENI